MDLFNVLQQMVSLAPGLRLVYRTNFAGMYNDISQVPFRGHHLGARHIFLTRERGGDQVVYFHNPKFARQPQLPSLEDIRSSGINALPLMTELFPEVRVFYDDDPDIPALTRVRAARAEQQRDEGVPMTIQELARPPPLPTSDTASRRSQAHYAWLVCCGSVFLIDTETKVLWASPDDSLLPLVALFLPEGADEPGDEEEGPRASEVDMSTAHGHVTLLPD